MKQLPMFDDTEDLKRYYSIGEVAEMFDISKSLIRFWEGEFDFLRPHKNSKGDRRFTPENIEQLRTIFILVKERGFTLEGAKRELKEQKVRRKQRNEMIGRLEKIRSFLVAMRDEEIKNISSE
jgi:DNA-binding transcriptional MerR regulator